MLQQQLVSVEKTDKKKMFTAAKKISLQQVTPHSVLMSYKAPLLPTPQ